MRKFPIIVFISLFLHTLVLRADERFGTIGQYSVQADYQFGRIIPHNSRFKAPVTGDTHSFELGFFKQTLGKAAWQHKLHYPEIGGGFIVAYNGDQKTFGNVYMGTVNAKFWIVRSRFVDFFVQIGTGIALVPRHFDIVKNPANDAIGSTFNSADQFRLGLDFKPAPYLHIMLGANFTHYSNAAFQLPNLGINVPALAVGLKYFPVVSKDMAYDRTKVPKPDKKNEVAVMLSLALTEQRPFGGPRYPVYIATVNYARYTSVANKVRIGMSTEFDQGQYDFIGYVDKTTKYTRTGTAMNASIFVGDEIMLGHVGLPFDVGVYVFNPLKNPPLYVKLGFNYYFVAVGKKKGTKFFIGANLKTHFLIAEFFEMSTGIAF